MDAALIRPGSAWDVSAIDPFLDSTRVPLNLACVTEAGPPLVCSLWFLRDGNDLWCATQSGARIVSHLERNPDCGFQVAPESMPYRGVRGQGRVTLLPEAGGDVLGRLIDRYFGSRDSNFAQWLLSRGDSEVALRIQPDWITAWDFSGRMEV